MVLLLRGITPPLVGLTRELMADLGDQHIAEGHHTTAVEAVEALPVDLVMASGKMVDTFQVLQMHAWSVSFSASRTILRKWAAA
jgi:hypothetical protein